MDQKVLEVQQWLNKTYGKVSGFGKVPENGQTGWDTIYGLRRGLQHELGITSLGDGFGDATKSALTKMIGSIKNGYTGNIAQLIKGAFWCKGISPTSFNNKFDADTTSAIKTLQSNAGISSTGTMTVNIMAALFDMSAFVLVPTGDAKVRSMQQYLNSKFSDSIGIMPADGIYQRDTNTALIYALQRAVGMSATQANGNYGSGTISATPTLNQGATGDIVRVIQYGLYVNGFYTGAFNGSFDSTVGNAIVSFRKFMNLPPFTTTADLTVIKGLLTSNGNTNRDSNMLDTSTQLTAKDVTNFKNYGFSIIGRYLTGSVGTGASKRNKYLTTSEIKEITSQGLSIFPIYEDGGYDPDYFKASQGTEDAVIAANAARSLGFPDNTTIYFAVDVDIQGGDIDNIVVPYIKAVSSTLSYLGYRTGIYGTRNVCLHVQNYVSYSFVADMSYGWSGNLGFRMPSNWSFDQFVEYPIGGTPIDQGASSGKDLGIKTFTQATINAQIGNIASKVVKLWPMYANAFGNINFNVAKWHQEADTGLAKLTLDISNDWSLGNASGLFTINVKSGRTVTDIATVTSQYPNIFKDIANGNNLAGLSKLANLVNNGNIKVGVYPTGTDGLTFQIIAESTLNNEINGNNVSNNFSISLKASFRPSGNFPVNSFNDASEKAKDFNSKTAGTDWGKVGIGVLAVGSMLAILVVVWAFAPEIGAEVTKFTTVVITAINNYFGLLKLV